MSAYKKLEWDFHFNFNWSKYYSYVTHQQEAKWLIHSAEIPKAVKTRHISSLLKGPYVMGLNFTNSKMHLWYEIFKFNPFAIPFSFKQLVYLLPASTQRGAEMETRLLYAVKFMWFPHFSWQPFPSRRSSKKFHLEWFVRTVTCAAFCRPFSAHPQTRYPWPMHRSIPHGSLHLESL